MTRLTIYVDDELEAKIRASAAALGQTLSIWLTRAAAESLAANPPPKPTKPPRLGVSSPKPKGARRERG